MNREATISEQALMPDIEPVLTRLPGYLWTTTEEAFLRQHYETAGPDHCARALAHRGLRAVYAKANALGLKARQIGTKGQRFARKYAPSERVDRVIAEGYRHMARRGDLKSIAERVGRPSWWVSARAIELGLTITRLKPLPWSRAEMALLHEYGACRIKVIAARLRAAGFTRTPTAIAVQIKRAQIDTSDPDAWTARDLGRLLGVADKTIGDWVERRGLTAEREPWGPHGRYRITRQALRVWLRENYGFVDLRRVDQPWFWGLVLGGAQ